MPADRYLHRPATQIRRKDRALADPEWMDRLLAAAAFGHLALTWQDRPILHSNLYWYDGERIFLHTAGVGRLRAILDLGPAAACFTVAEYGRLLPADTPFDFSVEYASVILYGTALEVTDRPAKRRALEGLMSKYAPHLQPGVDYTPMPDDDIDQTSVHCIEITERVGKHNVKPADYPGYVYRGEPFIETERAAGRYTIKAKELS